MTPRRKILARLTAASLAFAYASFAQAAWPSDMPINITVGFAPGGSTDVMARTLAPYIAKHLGDGAKIVIQNRPGASGEIAINSVMRAKPDGYSLVVVNLPGYFFVPMYRKASYSTQEVPLVARVVSDPTVMVVLKDSKFTDFKQVMDILKNSPSSITAGHNGIGTNGHLAMARLESTTATKFNAIPYNGTAQQKTALAGGTLDVAFVAASEIPDPEAEAKPVRLLAQFTREKVKRIATVPTTFELGQPVEMLAERGFAAPQGIAPPIMERLQKAIAAAMNDPEYIKAARNDGPFLSFLGGADWTRQMEQERKAYDSIAKSISKE